MFQHKRLCVFFQEGRCRYGDECRFSHAPAPKLAPIATSDPRAIPVFDPGPTRGSASVANNWATRPSSSPPLARVYQPVPVPSGVLLSARANLADVVNAVRVSAGQEPLSRTNKFFEILQVVVSNVDENEFESIGDSLREHLTFDYNSEHDSITDDEGCRDWDEDEDEDEDEDFGDLDLMSPLKKTTPEYTEPNFSPRQTAHYSRNSYSHDANNLRRETFFDWDLLDNPSVLNVYFGPNFSIEDSHIAGFSARPELCRRLQRFAAGDPETGNGGAVRNEAAFIQFVRLCTSMRVFKLEAFSSLSDATLLAIFEACPNIEMIQITAHDKIQGNVLGTALKQLAKTPSRATKLQALYLLDQDHKLDASVKVLSAARPRLWIFTGETYGKHDEDEGDSPQTWLGGKIVRIG